ncbi:hypothetical protein Unana1_04203 [Umbelopsis nana]
MVATSFWAAAAAALLTVAVDVTSAIDPIHVPIRRANRPHAPIGRRALMNSAQLFNAQKQGGYLIDLGIGTPAQNFSVLVDTGSTELWVPGPGCPKTECFGALFNTQASSSYIATTNPINLVYGVGSDNGTYGKDIVSVGGYTVQNLTFGVINSAANNTPPVSGEPYMNGILGLAFPNLTYAYQTGGVQYDPFVFALWKQKQIPQPIFSLYLGSRLSSGESGLITFGGIDNTKYTGSLQWVQVQKEANAPGLAPDYFHWTVLLLGVAVKVNGQQTSNLLGVASQQIVLDSGTTFSYLPYAAATNLMQAISPTAVLSQGMFIVDCSLASSTGTIEFAFGNSTTTSNAAIFSATISSLIIPLDGTTPQNSQQCAFGIAPMDGSLGVYLLGDTFLQSAYVVHNFQNYVIGIAAAASSGSSSGSTGSGSGSSGSTSTGSGSNSGASSISGSACKMIACFALAAAYLLL